MSKNAMAKVQTEERNKSPEDKLQEAVASVTEPVANHAALMVAGISTPGMERGKTVNAAYKPVNETLAAADKAATTLLKAMATSGVTIATKASLLGPVVADIICHLHKMTGEMPEDKTIKGRLYEHLDANGELQKNGKLESGSVARDAIWAAIGTAVRYGRLIYLGICKIMYREGSEMVDEAPNDKAQPVICHNWRECFPEQKHSKNKVITWSPNPDVWVPTSAADAKNAHGRLIEGKKSDRGGVPIPKKKAPTTPGVTETTVTLVNATNVQIIQAALDLAENISKATPDAHLSMWATLHGLIDDKLDSEGNIRETPKSEQGEAPKLPTLPSQRKSA